MTHTEIRGVSLFVDVVGNGPPLVLMHGGPGADHWTMQPFRRFSDRFTTVFYDHRCNGRSTGAAVETMTFDNLTADADTLREALGFERWAVLGHSFGGHVALEYALRYPDRLSHLVLLDTGADSRWPRENAPKLVAERGYGAEKAELVRRWFHGEFDAKDMTRILMRLGSIYNPHTNLLGSARMLLHGWRTKLRPEALIFAGQDRCWRAVVSLMPTSYAAAATEPARMDARRTSSCRRVSRCFVISRPSGGLQATATSPE